MNDLATPATIQAGVDKCMCSCHVVDGASCCSNCSVALPPQQRSFHRIHRVVQMCAPVTGTYVAKPSQICRQNGISIGSSVFAQLIREPTHSQTDRQTTLRHDVHSNSLHSHAGQCWRCGLIMTADVYSTRRMSLISNAIWTSDSVTVRCCPIMSKFEYMLRCRIRVAPAELL